jgi:hypothetical protein
LDKEILGAKPKVGAARPKIRFLFAKLSYFLRRIQYIEAHLVVFHWKSDFLGRKRAVSTSFSNFRPE